MKLITVNYLHLKISMNKKCAKKFGLSEGQLIDKSLFYKVVDYMWEEGKKK